MPAYPWLLSETLEFDTIPVSVDAMRMLGVPYDERDVARAVKAAQQQAREISAEIVKQGGPKDLYDKQITALIAYLQRLGTDINRPVEQEVAEQAGSVGAGAPASAMRAE